MAAVKLTLISLLLVLVLAPEWPIFQDERQQLSEIVDLREFDFLLWFLDALAVKAAGAASGAGAFLEPGAGSELVLSYLELTGEAQRLEGELNLIYADPEIADPALAGQDLAQSLAETRAELAFLQPLAEDVIQEQVATILSEEGFDVLGQVFPPVEMNMTPLPLVMIVSPREEIRRIYSVPLVAGLPTPEREALEVGVRRTIDRSALVVPIGGIGLYPAMIVETTNVNFLMDTVAHEWAHHWLTLQPLGVRYFATPEMRTINETVASIVGTEIGARVVRRFYPAFIPPQIEGAQEAAGELPSQDADIFDFRAEMAETRIEVDHLLEAGEVAAAEAYMEARRELFVARGYPIRKLNQAYFAFYGAYADTPGATGDDPVGPTVQALRAQSPSLRAFMDRVGDVTSFEELLLLVDQN
ncbi:MAG: hypothetical protein R3272_06600 [Candidatus Promineifilaceae bacterium]|nr:hypothetical protein [Candidatus Promineifilaceae bacterium]